MAKKKKENDIVTDGSRAITKFHVSDVVMVVILVILCATCVVPFIRKERTIEPSSKIDVYASRLKPIGQKLTLFARTAVLLETDFASNIGVYINGYDRLYMCSLSAVKKEIKGKNILYLYPDSLCQNCCIT